jgi:xanthine/uracil/vitamin C permease (AzgA family)
VCLGIALLLALSGLTDIDLIESGDYTLLQNGDLTPEIVISLCGVFLIGLLLYYKVKGAFVIGLFFSSIMYWWVYNDWPESVFATTVSLDFNNLDWSERNTWDVWSLVLDIVIIGNFTFIVVSIIELLLLLVYNRLQYDNVYVLFVIGVTLMNGLLVGTAPLMTKIVREDGSLPKEKWVYFSCGLGSILGGFLGCGPILLSAEAVPGIY